MSIENPRDLMRNVHRQSLHGDVVTTLDMTEGIHRQLGKLTGPGLNLDPDEFAQLRSLAATAYETAAAMRQITDTERGDVDA